MAEDSEIIGFAVALVVIGVVFAQLIVSPIFATGQETLNDDVEIANDEGTIETGWLTSIDSLTSTEATLGDSVRLTGASDSEVVASGVGDMGETFTVCSHATAAQSVVDNNETRVILRYSGVALEYNGSDDVYRAWWYNESSRQTYDATVAATSPAERTAVCATHNGTHLFVYENTTKGTPVATSGTSSASLNADNWNGTLDETRLYAAPLNDSQVSEYVNEPAVGVSGTRVDARLMYDTRDDTATSVPVYFAGADAELSNASFGSGVSGPSLSEGTDYERDGDTLIALDGGALSGDGDVLFVTFDTARGTPAELAALGASLFVLGIMVNKLFGLWEGA